MYIILPRQPSAMTGGAALGRRGLRNVAVSCLEVERQKRAFDKYLFLCLSLSIYIYIYM